MQPASKYVSLIRPSKDSAKEGKTKNNKAMDMAMDMNMAKPPILGVISVCTFLGSGLSVAPILLANRITRGVTISEIITGSKNEDRME
jgi:hypothetical protein